MISPRAQTLSSNETGFRLICTTPVALPVVDQVIQPNVIRTVVFTVNWLGPGAKVKELRQAEINRWWESQTQPDKVFPPGTPGKGIARMLVAFTVVTGTK